MNLNSEYIAERINNDKLVDFIIIHKEAFKSKITKGYQRKKFNTTSIAGIENLGYIIYHVSGEPVAYYGVYPLYAYLDKKLILISQSGDTMTKPAHIGNGLFISAAKLTYNLCKENNISGVFGFPSPSSFPGFKKKLDWKFNESINRYRFFVPTFPLSIISNKINFINTIYLFWVRIVLSFYKKSPFFEGSVIRNGQDGIYRNEAFWAYKLQCNDIFAINIAGTGIVIKFNGRLSVGDINIDRNSPIKLILKKLKLLSFLTFNTHIVFGVSPDTVLDEKLRSIKKSITGLPIGFLNFNDEFDLSTLKFTYFDFDTF